MNRIIHRLGKSFSEILKKEGNSNFDPYNVDPKKYLDLDGKVKSKTGYALVEVEPFPRMKIMELGVLILKKTKELPEKAICRIMTEEKTKYIMEITHNFPNILQLESKLGTDSIELFIEEMAQNIAAIESMKEIKPWLDDDDNLDDECYNLLKNPKDEDLKKDGEAIKRIRSLFNNHN